MNWVLNSVLNSLDGTFSNYGSLDIFDDEDGGHSIVPWMARQYPNGDWKLYVYDSNKAFVEDDISTPRDESISGGVWWIQNRQFLSDFTVSRAFPAVDINLSTNSWQYEVSTDTFWNDDIYFVPNSAVVGKENYNAIPNGNNLIIRDHTLPSMSAETWRWFRLLFVSKNENVSITIEDEFGNTNMAPRLKSGNGVIEIPFLDVDPNKMQIFLLPKDKKIKITFSGQQQGSYDIHLINGYTYTSIEGKTIMPQMRDVLEITADKGTEDAQNLSLISGLSDDTFTITSSFAYAKSQKNEIVDAEKTYRLSNIALQANMPVNIALNNYAENLTITSEQKSGFSFDLTVEETSSKGDLVKVHEGKVTPTHISDKAFFDFNLTKER